MGSYHNRLTAKSPSNWLKSTTTNLLLATLLVLASIIQSNVYCQDFEDLNQNQNQNGFSRQGQSNAGGPQQFMAPQQQQAQNLQISYQTNRQSIGGAAQASFSAQGNNGGQPQLQQQQQQPQQFQAQTNSRQLQRPILTNRFSQQQQLGAQASTSNAVVVSNVPQQAPAASQSSSQSSGATRRLEVSPASGQEARQEPSSSSSSEPIQSRSGSQFQGPAQTTASQAAQNAREDKQAESSETQASSSAQPSSSGEEQQTSTTSAAGATSGHETVYSDQRFANLFARRNNQKKTKFTPTETAKAKPTLPSFIKSPPDPKQFTGPSAEISQDRPITPASSNLISARAQQQSNQNKLQGLASSQKKTSAALTAAPSTPGNKRGQNSLSPKPSGAAAAASAKPSKAQVGSSTQSSNAAGKPVSSNNPFNNRSNQLNSSDPANVIAMARRRLLANNAAAASSQQQRPSAAGAN